MSGIASRLAGPACSGRGSAPRAGGRARSGSRPRRPGLGDDLQAGLGVEQHPQGAAHHGVVIGQDDPDHVGPGSGVSLVAGLGARCIMRSRVGAGEAPHQQTTRISLREIRTPLGHREPPLVRATRSVCAPGRAVPARREHRVGEPDPVGLGQGHGVEADPLAGGEPVEMHGQVDVDEEVLAPVERRADPVAGSATTRTAASGDSSSPATIGTRDRIQTMAGPAPEPPPRRTGTRPRRGSRPRIRSGRTGGHRRRRGRRPAPRTPGAAVHAPVRSRQPVAPSPPRRPREGRPEHLHAPPLADERRLHAQRRDRDRPQHLVRHPPHAHLVAVDRPSRSSARPSSAPGGPACWDPGPMAHASTRRARPLPVELEEGVRGHAGET